MEDIFSTYKIAKFLKTKGFEDECLAHFSYNGSLHVLHYGNCGSKRQDKYSTLAPTWEQVNKFFIEKGFDSYVYPSRDKYFAHIIKNKRESILNKEFDEYNVARTHMYEFLINKLK